MDDVMSNMEGMEDVDLMEEMDMNEPTEFKDGGGYRVYRSRERKGKTHKVVGPGGKVKYFGDPNLGERGKSKYGKKAFYARHRKNLAKNPFFRAYARATWQDGGYTTLSPQGITFTPTINRETGGEFGSPDNNYYYGDASGSYLNAMNYGGMYQEGGMMANPEAQSGADQQMQQIMQAVVQMLQEGNEPTQVVQALVQEGLPQEAAGQIVGSVMREMQGGAEQAMQQQMPMNQGMPMQQGGMMSSGQQGQMEQLMAAVAQMLQQTKDPMTVVKALVQKGMSEEQAGQIVEAVMQDMQAAASEAKAAGTLGQPQGAPQMGEPMMEEGGMMEYKKGGIYIKPSKRGTFTAAAKKRGMGVQEFASKVMANKEDYSSAMVKKANFARNASKWKHAMGGPLMYQQNVGILPVAGPIGSGMPGGAPYETEQVDYTDNIFIDPVTQAKVDEAYQSSRLAPLQPMISTLPPATLVPMGGRKPIMPPKPSITADPTGGEGVDPNAPLTATVTPYKSSIAPYIVGGIGSAMGPIANMIAAAAIPDATYTPAAKFKRQGYTPVALARQQANQAIAANRDAMRMAAPTQGSLLGNLAVSLPSTASSLGNMLAQTRYGIDAANIDITNKEALNRQAVAQQNALLKDQSIAQRWNLGLAGAQGIGTGMQGLTRDLSQRQREDYMINNMKTSDFAGFKYVQDPNDPKKFKMVPSYTGSATYTDENGNTVITGADGKKYIQKK